MHISSRRKKLYPNSSGMNPLKHHLRTLREDFLHTPGWRVWLASISGTLLLLTFAGLLMPKFVDLDNKPTSSEFLLTALVALFLPAIFEETIFRGLLNLPQTRLSILLSTLAFVTWHPLGAFLFLPKAKAYFTDLRFLLIVTFLGFFFCILRKWGKSIWPCILCHWLIVIAWKGFGGARFLT